MGIIVNTVQDVASYGQIGISGAEAGGSIVNLSPAACGPMGDFRTGANGCPLSAECRDFIKAVASGKLELADFGSGLIYGAQIVAIGGFSSPALKPVSPLAQKLHALDIGALMIGSQRFQSGMKNEYVNLNQPTSTVQSSGSGSSQSQTQQVVHNNSEEGENGGGNGGEASVDAEKEGQKSDDLMGNIGWLSGDPARHQPNQDEDHCHNDKYPPPEEEQERDVVYNTQRNRQFYNKNKSRNHYEAERRQERRTQKFQRQEANKQSWVDHQAREDEDAKWAPVDREDEKRQKKIAEAMNKGHSATTVSAEADLGASEDVNSLPGRNDGKKERFTSRMKR